MKRKLVMLLTIVAVLAVGIGIWYNVPIKMCIRDRWEEAPRPDAHSSGGRYEHQYLFPQTWHCIAPPMLHANVPAFRDCPSR